MDFKEGDVVMLKSGGPLMTIMRFKDNGNAVCEWFNQQENTFEYKWQEFAQISLKAVN